MASIKDIIKREVNPFGSVTFDTGNFWQEQQNSELIVESIHQEAIDKIIESLDTISRDHKTRTLLLCGDGGSGKSYLLARLKQQLNSKAFFAYIGSWAEGDHIYRHILRQTVDSLMQIPEGAKESQLLLWLKSRSAFKDRSLMKRVFGERQLFISNFKATYPVGISNPDKFFRVLYYLTNSELYNSSCEWLRGDNLDEENLKALGLNKSIESETEAHNILTNLGRICSETQPIVLCFDQIDRNARPPHGYSGIQPLFEFNTTIHNERLKNFLIIVSLVKETWEENEKYIIESDKDRLTDKIFLKSITLEQGESIWEKRLFPLHQQANPKPKSPIEPLSREALEKKFPGGKTNPRDILKLGQQLIQEYKIDKITPIDRIAAFQLVWLKAFNKTQSKYSKISQISDVDLMAMLQETLTALEVKEIKTKLLSSPTFASSSLSYQAPNQQVKVGLIWAEFLNMNGFSSLMKACQKAINNNLCQSLYLIRAAEIGKPTNQGYKIHAKIFTASSHHHNHIKPHLNSVWYLATYQSLVNAACAGALVVGYQTPNLSELEALIRESKVLDDCQLLQDLGIVKPITLPDPDLKLVKNFLLNFVTTQKMIGMPILIQNACSQFTKVNQSQVEQLIDELCQEKEISILDPNAKLKEQLICLVPKS